MLVFRIGYSALDAKMDKLVEAPCKRPFLDSGFEQNKWRSVHPIQTRPRPFIAVLIPWKPLVIQITYVWTPNGKSPLSPTHIMVQRKAGTGQKLVISSCTCRFPCVKCGLAQGYTNPRVEGELFCVGLLHAHLHFCIQLISTQIRVLPSKSLTQVVSTEDVQVQNHT